MMNSNSLKTYQEIKDEGLHETRMNEVLDIIRRTPFMTGREYASLLGHTDMNIVRPRVTDLKVSGCIIEVGKRKCSLSKRTCHVWATYEGVEKHILKKLGFIETQRNLYSFNIDDIILFQDFRKGRRSSYIISGRGTDKNYKELDVYKEFKSKLNSMLGLE